MLFSKLTSNQFIDGMKKIFDLEPFINLTVLKCLTIKELIKSNLEFN